MVVGNSQVVIYGLSGGVTKSFSHILQDLEFGKHIDEGTKCHCLVESAY
jgi:hypothetical protein